MLNKLRCHTHFYFSANQISWSRLLIQIHILTDKQCRSWSVGFVRSQLIWIYTVCKGRAYLGSAGLGLMWKVHIPLWSGRRASCKLRGYRYPCCFWFCSNERLRRPFLREWFLRGNRCRCPTLAGWEYCRLVGWNVSRTQVHRSHRKTLILERKTIVLTRNI